MEWWCSDNVVILDSVNKMNMTDTFVAEVLAPDRLGPLAGMLIPGLVGPLGLGPGLGPGLGLVSPLVMLTANEVANGLVFLIGISIAIAIILVVVNGLVRLIVPLLVLIVDSEHLLVVNVPDELLSTVVAIDIPDVLNMLLIPILVRDAIVEILATAGLGLGLGLSPLAMPIATELLKLAAVLVPVVDALAMCRMTPVILLPPVAVGIPIAMAMLPDVLSVRVLMPIGEVDYLAGRLVGAIAMLAQLIELTPSIGMAMLIASVFLLIEVAMLLVAVDRQLS